jgi:hypothetical protein
MLQQTGRRSGPGRDRHEAFEMRDGRDATALLAAAFSRLRPAVVVLCLAMLAAPVSAAEDRRSYLTSGELLQRALDSLFDRIGAKPKLSMVSVEPALITVLTQGPDAPYHTDEWTISRFDYLWFDRDSVSGPAPHQSNGIVPEAENSFFDISEVNIAGLEDIVARAADYARLEDAASISSLRIARQIHLAPQRAYGPVEWRIGLSSGRESATVYADAAGRITGGDLSGTIRAQHVDLLSRDDWPAEEAQALLSAEIGDRPIVHEVGISKSGVGVRAEHPAQSNLLRDYFWDYSGITRGSVDVPNPLAAGPGGLAPFSLSDIKLSALASIKAAAKRAYQSESAAIVGIAATKPASQAKIRWRVDFQEPTGETGHVDVGVAGEVLETVLPENREPKG